MASFKRLKKRPVSKTECRALDIKDFMRDIIKGLTLAAAGLD
jgi:hypothetical protein